MEYLFYILLFSYIFYFMENLYSFFIIVYKFVLVYFKCLTHDYETCSVITTDKKCAGVIVKSPCKRTDCLFINAQFNSTSAGQSF